jgi:hypothetical protein
MLRKSRGMETQWCAVCGAPASWCYDIEDAGPEDRIVFAPSWPMCDDCHALAERQDLPGLRKRWDLGPDSTNRSSRKYATREFLARRRRARLL